MALTNLEIAEQLIEILGGKENIVDSTSCMTRMHLTLVDRDRIDFEKLENLEGVLGTVQGDKFQVIFGPAKSTRINDEFLNLLQERSEKDI